MGKVLDITNFINKHPGGEEILLKHGGQDATEVFIETGHVKHHILEYLSELPYVGFLE